MDILCSPRAKSISVFEPIERFISVFEHCSSFAKSLAQGGQDLNTVIYHFPSDVLPKSIDIRWKGLPITGSVDWKEMQRTFELQASRVHRTTTLLIGRKSHEDDIFSNSGYTPSDDFDCHKLWVACCRSQSKFDVQSKHHATSTALVEPAHSSIVQKQRQYWISLVCFARQSQSRIHQGVVVWSALCIFLPSL